jgi:histidyl-tRNA synthetase
MDKPDEDKVSPRIEPRIFRGTHDVLPAEMAVKRRMVQVIESVYQQYGFQPLETPALEFWDILTGKSGEEGDKLLYPLAYKGGKTLALRYDLTVPLARVIAMYPDLPMPFKRYQIQPVWRADRPQPHQGRFREFLQCDADVVGTTSPLADAEILVMISEVLTTLQFPRFIIRLSSRKILSGIVELAVHDVSQTPWICRAIDKLEKVGMEGVIEELRQGGMADAGLKQVIPFLQLSRGSAALKDVRALIEPSPIGTEGVQEVESVLSAALSLGIPKAQLEFDPTLARGLDYYTGAIFETCLPDYPHIGSITGGGRYDRLVGVFLGKDIPATGSTIGLDRMAAVMDQLGLIPSTVSSAQVLVVLFGGDGTGRSLSLAAELRRAGIATEVYPEPVRLKKQFQYADRKGIPFVLVPGPEEWERGEITLKEMRTGEQISIQRNSIISVLKNRKIT